MTAIGNTNPGPSSRQTVNQSSGLPATWTDSTGTYLEKPDGTSIAVGGAGTTTYTTAESFGASPSATNAANTAAINSALALGGVVTLYTAGTYVLDASKTVTRASTLTYQVCLVIPSNTTFMVGPGVILKAADGLNNVAVIQNSNVAGGNTNISLVGGIYDGNSANTTRTDGAADFACIAVWLQNITNLYLTDFTLTNPQAWGIGIAACVNVRTYKTNFPYTAAVTVNQGGFQFQGANNDIVVRDTFGKTPDDLVAFVTDDHTIFNAAMAGPGAASDILVDGVFSDRTVGCGELFRLLDSTTYTINRVFARNISGPYYLSAMTLGPSAGKTSFLRNILIDGVDCNPIGAATQATITLNGAIDSLAINNLNRLYTDGTETGGKKSVMTLTAGIVSRLKLSNWHIDDQVTLGANVNFIDVTGSGVISELETVNISVNVLLSTGKNTLVHVGGTSTFIHRWMGSNFSCIRLGTLFYTNSTGGSSRGLFLSNGYFENGQAAFIQTGATTSLPFISLSAFNLVTAWSASLGIFRFNGLSGTCVIDLNGCSMANGANPIFTRAASESVRVRSLSVPVDNTFLTAALGDVFLDSLNSNAPYRCSTAPSTFTAL